MMPTEGPAAAQPCIAVDARAKAIASEYSVGFVALALLAIYFGLQIVTRILLSNNLQLDEAEQFVLAQDWRLGYGSQPPLYTWIQNALFAIFGANVAALSLLKNVTLWSTYAFTFLAARGILCEKRLSALGAVGLLFLPQIAWESQRDQSHLTLATAFSAVTLYAFVRLLKTAEWRWFCAFGLAAGLGFLSKYNFALLPVALLPAALRFQPFRRTILNLRMIASLAAFLIVTAPHLVWMLQNKEAVLSQTYKFVIVSHTGAASFGTGAFQTAQAALALFAAPLVVFALFVWRPNQSVSREPNDFVAMLWRSYWIGITLTLAVVWIFKVTYLRDRWLQPLLFSLPIALAGSLQNRIDARRFTSLMTLAGAIGLTVLIAINGTALFANQLRRSHNLNIPYLALATKLRNTGFEQGTILASGFLLGGNLKNQFPASRVEVPELQEKFSSPGKTLIIWTARDREVPESFLQYASKVSGLDSSKFQPAFLEIPCANGRRRSELFGFVLVNGAAKL